MLKLLVGGLVAATILLSLVFIVGPVLLVLAAIFFGVIPAQRYFKYRMLLEKYGNESLARMLANKTIWENQTAEQLNDALGAPVGVTQQGLTEIRTYRRKFSLGGFSTRVTLEDGLVKSWGNA